MTELNCSYNILTSLEGLENCTALTELDCSYSLLASLEGLENCTALTELICSCNSLTSLEGLENCTALTRLVFHSNNLTSLPPFLTGFRRLAYIDDRDNPIETIPLQVERFLQRIEDRQGSGVRLYTDGQNVHDSAVVKSVRTSLTEILKEEVVEDLPEF